MSFISDAEIVIKALNEYLAESKAGEKPVINQVPLGDLINDLNLSAYVRNWGRNGHAGHLQRAL